MLKRRVGERHAHDSSTQRGSSPRTAAAPGFLSRRHRGIPVPGTTPLVALKLMWPEFRCIDSGAGHYVSIVYRGEFGATTLFAAARIEITPLRAVSA
jgi:hypothetical protein